jgi:hypothetical protein
MALITYPRISAYGLNIKPSAVTNMYIFEAGTTTPKTTYSIPAMTAGTEQTHPVPSDSKGVFPAMYTNGTFKIVIKDTLGNTVYTDDNQVGRGGDWQDKGTFDSTTNSSNYPASGSLGDVYRCIETFTLAAASGSHKMFDGDFIVANKNGATAIDADWQIFRGGITNVINTVALTDGATIATDCSLGTVFTVTKAEDGVLSNPTNKNTGQVYEWHITQNATGGWALTFGTDFVFDAGSLIKPEAGAVTIIRGTCISSTVIKAVVVRDISVRFESENLKLGTVTNTTVPITADRISYLTDSGDTLFENDIDDAWDITADLMAGTTEKASHWYQLWRDSAAVMKMAPDLTGTADADVANSLSVSTATFQTDLVQVDDEIYNLTDLTKGYVKAVSSETVITCKDADGNDLDLFPDGNEDFMIRMLSPVGLGTHKSRIGAAYNNGSSNLDNSTYTQIQEEKYYSESAGDFTITSTLWTNAYAIISVKQKNDWTGKGEWYIDYKFDGVKTSTAVNDFTFTFSGVTFKNVSGFNQSCSGFFDVTPTTKFIHQAYAIANTATVRITASTTINDLGSSGDNLLCEKKPTFHT